MYSPQSSTYEAFLDGHNLYRPVFLAKANPVLDDMLRIHYFSKLNKGDRMFVVDLTSVSFFSPGDFREILNNNDQYYKIPFLYLVSSYTRNYVVEEALKRLRLNGHYTTGAWLIYVFEKV